LQRQNKKKLEEIADFNEVVERVEWVPTDKDISGNLFAADPRNKARIRDIESSHVDKESLWQVGKQDKELSAERTKKLKILEKYNNHLWEQSKLASEKFKNSGLSDPSKTEFVQFIDNTTAAINKAANTNIRLLSPKKKLNSSTFFRMKSVADTLVNARMMSPRKQSILNPFDKLHANLEEKPLSEKEILSGELESPRIKNPVKFTINTNQLDNSFRIPKIGNDISLESPNSQKRAELPANAAMSRLIAEHSKFHAIFGSVASSQNPQKEANQESPTSRLNSPTGAETKIKNFKLSKLMARNSQNPFQMSKYSQYSPRVTSPNNTSRVNSPNSKSPADTLDQYYHPDVDLMNNPEHFKEYNQGYSMTPFEKFGRSIFHNQHIINMPRIAKDLPFAAQIIQRKVMDFSKANKQTEATIKKLNENIATYKERQNRARKAAQMRSACRSGVVSPNTEIDQEQRDSSSFREDIAEKAKDVEVPVIEQRASKREMRRPSKTARNYLKPIFTNKTTNHSRKNSKTNSLKSSRLSNKEENFLGETSIKNVNNDQTPVKQKLKQTNFFSTELSASPPKGTKTLKEKSATSPHCNTQLKSSKNSVCQKNKSLLVKYPTLNLASKSNVPKSKSFSHRKTEEIQANQINNLKQTKSLMHSKHKKELKLVIKENIDDEPDEGNHEELGSPDNPVGTYDMLHLKTPFSQFLVLESLDKNRDTIPEIVVRKRKINPRGVRPPLPTSPSHKGKETSKSVGHTSITSEKDQDTQSLFPVQSNSKKTSSELHTLRKSLQNFCRMVDKSDIADAVHPPSEIVSKVVSTVDQFKSQHEGADFIELFHDYFTQPEPEHVMKAAGKIYKNSGIKFRKRVLVLTTRFNLSKGGTIGVKPENDDTGSFYFR
jgi:hypothetical protein